MAAKFARLAKKRTKVQVTRLVDYRASNVKLCFAIPEKQSQKHSLELQTNAVFRHVCLSKFVEILLAHAVQRPTTTCRGVKNLNNPSSKSETNISPYRPGQVQNLRTVPGVAVLSRRNRGSQALGVVGARADAIQVAAHVGSSRRGSG
jgi:hypothetical protein